MKKITKKKQKNLLKLAIYLLNFKPNGIKFNMNQYSSYDFEDYKTDCGTVGCAAGHAPYAGIKKRCSEDWYQFVNRQLINDMDSFMWMFASKWSTFDNTAIGAAKRILAFLDNDCNVPYGNINFYLDTSIEIAIKEYNKEYSIDSVVSIRKKLGI